MQLAWVTVIPYALPFKQPYVTAQGTLTQREMVLLRLRDSEGAGGLGKPSRFSLRGGATLSSGWSRVRNSPTATRSPTS